MRRLILLSLLLATVGACIAPGPATEFSQESAAPGSRLEFSFQPDLPISAPPYSEVHTNWKQRIDQPYVFVEFVGSYTETGRLLPMIQEALREQGLRPDGPPFVLFYDDPGKVPVERLRSRACVPVATRVDVRGTIAFDLLPSTTVVYSYVSGAYPGVPRAYPGMYSYMSDSGWVENGPIRETYLISPASIESFDELLTEIQIPVTFAR